MILLRWMDRFGSVCESAIYAFIHLVCYWKGHHQKSSYTIVIITKYMVARFYSIYLDSLYKIIKLENSILFMVLKVVSYPTYVVLSKLLTQSDFFLSLLILESFDIRRE